MPHLPQDFPRRHVSDSSTNNIYRNFDGSNMINFSKQVRRTDRSYYTGIYGDRDRGGGTGIEFRPCNGEDESGVTSPPLWHTSPPKSPPPTELTPLQSSAYTHHHYRSLSPTSRLRAIERGKEELMEMVKTMPESHYELSLKDLVEHSRAHETRQLATSVEMDSKESRMKKKKTNKFDQRQILRSGSGTDNRPVLLKMFCPVPLRSKKNKSNSITSNGTGAKVSPRPVEGEKFADKEWWRKRLSVPGEREPNGSGSSSGSSHGSRSRSKEPLVPGCWSFFHKKSKSR